MTQVRAQGDCVLPVVACQMAGVFGLLGAGRTETFKVVAGLIKRDYLHDGEVLLRGHRERYRVARQAVADGIAYITEDRKVEAFSSPVHHPEHRHGLAGQAGFEVRSAQPGPRQPHGRALESTAQCARQAVVVLSSYLSEVMALSDRILVAEQGKVIFEFSAEQATQEAIMYAAIL